MEHGLEVQVRHRPALDPGFVPAVLWNRAYQARVKATGGSVELGIALVRQDGTTFTHRTRILPPTAAHAALNQKYVERLVKLLLWQKGGCTILVKGCDPVARALAAAYSEKGLRSFDRDLVGEHDLAVHDRRALAVGAAEVEPDPAALEVAPERLRRLARGGQLAADRLHLDRLAEHPPADEVAVEGA